MTETVTAPRRPGPARSLSREQVVAAALEVLAADGSKAVSFRSIATRLGVDPKALYTYVADKDDLLTGMLEAALAELDLPQRDDSRPPLEQLLALAVSMRATFLANAELFHLTSPRVDLAVGRAETRIIWATLMAHVGDPARAAELYTDLVQLAIGSALETARSQRTGAARDAFLATIDQTTEPDVIAMTHAMGKVDRDRAFARLVRGVLEQAAG